MPLPLWFSSGCKRHVKSLCVRVCMCTWYLHECRHSMMVVASTRYPLHRAQIRCWLTSVTFSRVIRCILQIYKTSTLHQKFIIHPWLWFKELFPNHMGEIYAFIKFECTSFKIMGENTKWNRLYPSARPANVTEPIVRESILIHNFLVVLLFKV